MSSTSQLLAEIGGLGPAAIPDIEYELAWAQRSTAYTARGQIPWSRHFPWLRNRLSEAPSESGTMCSSVGRSSSGPVSTIRFRHQQHR
jgi:hypothetical protein